MNGSKQIATGEIVGCFLKMDEASYQSAPG